MEILNVNKIRESKIIGQFDMHKYTPKKFEIHMQYVTKIYGIVDMSPHLYG